MRIDQPDLLCADCQTKLSSLETEPSCPRCAAPTGPGGACPHCAGKGVRPFDQIICLGRFDDPLRGLIHDMKYHQRWPLAELLADRLFDQPAVRRLLEQTKQRDGALIAVPLHPWRRFWRGYNQAQLLANRLSGHGAVSAVHPLVRCRWTPTQTFLHSRARRTANLRDAFALIHPQQVHQRHLVLVDDVMTSGATLRAAARTLLPARPASISAIVLAVADPRHRNFQRV